VDVDSASGNDDGDQSEDDEDKAVIVGEECLIDLELEQLVKIGCVTLPGSADDYYAVDGPVSIATQPQFGEVTPLNNGRIVYCPDLAYQDGVEDEFQYTVTGIDGTTETVTATVAIEGENNPDVFCAQDDRLDINPYLTVLDTIPVFELQPVLDADGNPVVGADGIPDSTNIEVGEEAIDITPAQPSYSIAVLANDKNEDPSTLTIVSGPSNGVATIVGNSIVFEPELDYEMGIVEITYMVESNNGLPAKEAVLHMLINGVEELVTLEDDLCVCPGNKYNVGEIICYRVVLTNDGECDASGIQVLDNLSDCLIYLDSNPFIGTGVEPGTTAGYFNEETGTWFVDSLASGDTIALDILVEVGCAGEIPNTAETVEANEVDIDSDPGNNIITEDDIDEEIIIGCQIDLEVDKTVDNPQVGVGENVVFTVEVSNMGPFAATGVTVIDRLPEGLTYISHSGGIYNAGNGIWSVGSVAVGETKTLLITARVDQVGELCNSAEVASANQPDVDSTPDDEPDFENDNDSEDDQDKAYLNGEAVDLELDKAIVGTEDSYNVGDEVTFELTIDNNGAVAATNVEVTDNLPACLEFVAADPSVGSYAAGVWTIAEIAPGETEVLTLSAILIEAGECINTAEVTAVDQVDLDSDEANDDGDQSEDDEDAAAVEGKLIDLEIEKTADATSVLVGDQFTYTVEISNLGPNDATGVEVLDDLPANVIYVSSAASQGAYNDNVSTWVIGNLGVDDFAVLNITVEVITPGEFLNVAQVSAADQPDVDSEPENDDGDQSEDDEDGVIVGGEQIDLKLEKTTDATDVNVGDQFTYTIILTNEGPSDGSGIVVTDNLPAEVTFISADGTYDETTGEWAVGVLAAGETVSLNILVELNTFGETITNSAEVTDADQPDGDSEPDNDDPTEDDQDEVNVGGVEVDVELIKTVSATSVNVGDEVTWTITVQNQGPSTATNVVVGDALPAGLTITGADPQVGTIDGTVCSVGTIPVGASYDLEITTTVDGTGPYVNIAEVISHDQTDIDSEPGNDDGDQSEYDEDSAQVEGMQIDLELVKDVNVEIVTVGEEFEYTITVTNEGPSDATGVVVTDNLPPCISYVDASLTTGVFNSAIGEWTIGDLALDESATMIITVLAEDECDPVINTAQVSEADQPDLDSDPGNDDGDQSEDDEDNAPVTIQGLIDVELTKTVSDSIVNVGDQVIWTIEVVNLGPSDATNLTVVDPIPAGLTVVSVSASAGGYAGDTWTIGTLGVGVTRTLEVVTTVDEIGPIVNIAEVGAHDQQDIDSEPGNNDGDQSEDDEDDAQVRAEQIDLELQKTADATSVNIGDQFTYTVSIQNLGPSDATGVTVFDQLPGEVIYISDNPSSGTFASGSGLWTIGDIANGGAETLEITVEVIAPGDFRNIAQVSEADQPDVDSGPGNDDGDQSEDDEDGIDVTGEQIDLELEKTADATDVNVGDEFTYTITLTNQGPSDGTGIVVTDNLPADVAFVSADGAYDDASGEWTVGDLAAGASTTLNITVQLL